MTCPWPIAIAVVALITGCMEIGGGGSVHIPPASVTAGQPVTLELELTAVGGANGRFANVRCIYWTDGGTGARSLLMDEVGPTELGTKFSVKLPPSEKAGWVRYYFRFDFDGQSKDRGSVQQPFEIVVTNAT